MSKKFSYLAGILLTIIIGTLLFWYFCCNDKGNGRNMETAAAKPSIIPGEQVEEPAAPAPEPEVSVNWQAVKDQLNDNPLTPYFEPYQTERTLGQQELNKLNEIKEYLENNPAGSLLVTGHTDITGSRALNMRLSRERAAFLAGSLVQNGIDEDKITSTFKGPDDPVADNSTPEGRAKNRRAVVIIN